MRKVMTAERIITVSLLLAGAIGLTACGEKDSHHDSPPDTSSKPAIKCESISHPKTSPISHDRICADGVRSFLVRVEKSKDAFDFDTAVTERCEGHDLARLTALAPYYNGYIQAQYGLHTDFSQDHPACPKITPDDIHDGRLG